MHNSPSVPWKIRLRSSIGSRILSDLWSVSIHSARQFGERDQRLPLPVRLRAVAKCDYRVSMQRLPASTLLSFGRTASLCVIAMEVTVFQHQGSLCPLHEVTWSTSTSRRQTRSILVMDRANTHKLESLYRAFTRHPKPGVWPTILEIAITSPISMAVASTIELKSNSVSCIVNA